MNRDEVVAADKAHSWHPFTQMADWCAEEHEPILIERGEGAYLYDQSGTRYFDGNSSIWTNIHGHGHPTITAAIVDQASKIAHSSYLGLGHAPGAELAKRLADLIPGGALPRVFFTDDGSTAIECAVRMALEYWDRSSEKRDLFVAFDGAYHGDTLGAAGLGGIDAFRGPIDRLGLDVIRVADRNALAELAEKDVARLAGVVIEPLIQGAAGMRTWPSGMLGELREWCDENGAFLILDEVMTGFGRTGTMFAFEQEGIVPDFLCLAKGLTGGTLPLAATMTTERVYEAFLGDYAEQKTFFYGHSYTANPMGCRAALASLEVFEQEGTLEGLGEKIEAMTALLSGLEQDISEVKEIRQCGMIAGIDLGDYPWKEQIGVRVCEAARAYGLLTRPVGNTIVLMPPLCSTLDQIEAAVEAIRLGIRDVLGNGV